MDVFREIIYARCTAGVSMQQCFTELVGLLRVTVLRTYREFSDPSHDALLAIEDNDEELNNNDFLLTNHNEKNPVDDHETVEAQAQASGSIPTDMQIQTLNSDDNMVVNVGEQRLLRLIRSNNLKIESIIDYTLGLVKRPHLEIEEISDDEDIVTETMEPEKAGIKYSKLNKEILKLMKSNQYPDVDLLLKNILKLLVQDRSVVFRDLIITLIDNHNVMVKTVGKRANTRQEIGVNTILTGDVIKTPSQKSPTKRQDLIPLNNESERNLIEFNMPLEEIVPVRDNTVPNQQYDPELPPQQYNRPLQYLHQNISQPHPALRQETISHPIMNPPQLMNPQHNQFNYFQYPTRPMQQAPLKSKDNPIPLIKRPQKPQNVNQVKHMKKQNAPAPRPVNEQNVSSGNQNQAYFNQSRVYQQSESNMNSFQSMAARMPNLQTVHGVGSTPMAQMPWPDRSRSQTPLPPDYMMRRERNTMNQNRMDPRMQDATNRDNAYPGNVPENVFQGNQGLYYGNNPLPLQNVQQNNIGPQRMLPQVGWDAQMYPYSSSARAPNTRMYDSHGRYQ